MRLRIRALNNRMLFAMPAIAAVIVSMCVLAGSSPAWATSVVHRSVSEMTVVSKLVVSGIVSDVKPNVRRPGLPIGTKVTIAVNKVLKGFASGPTISFVLPGGVVDGKAMLIPGMPSFTAGEEVVVFLEKTPSGWIPSGLANGKYRVITDEAGNRTVTRDASELHRVNSDGLVDRKTRVASDDMSFDELVRHVNAGKAAEKAKLSTSASKRGVPASVRQGGAR